MSLVGDWAYARTKNVLPFVLLSGLCFGLIQFAVFHIISCALVASKLPGGFSLSSWAGAIGSRFADGESMFVSGAIYLFAGLLWASWEWNFKYKDMSR
jgi:hypothetical protein